MTSRFSNAGVDLTPHVDEIRAQIMPVNKAWPMARLKEALLAFPRFSQAAFCVEYVLIPGVNDRDEHCDEVCAFLREVRCSLNVIPYNPRRDSPWPAPDEALVERFDVRTPSIHTHGGSLSGGNQQKIMIAKAMARDIAAQEFE